MTSCLGACVASVNACKILSSDGVSRGSFSLEKERYVYQRISTRTEEDHKKRFLTERRKTKAAVKVAYNASCQARRKRHSFTSSSSPKQHTTHERNIENVHPTRALVLHERGYRPDDCICDEARAMGRSGGFYRVLDDWYVISSLFEYVVLRAKCVRSFVLGGIGSLSLSLVCFRSFSRVESLSFFLSLSLFLNNIR